MIETKCKEFALFCQLGKKEKEETQITIKQNCTAKLNHQVAHPL
jgi:hypothetical protein